VEVGVRMAGQICKRLRFSNDETGQIQALVANHMKFKDVAQMKKSTLKRFVRLPDFLEHLELHHLDCRASHGRFDAYVMVRDFLAQTPPDQVQPTRLLTGDDLNEMGYPPGPHYQQILAALEDAQLEGTVSTRDDAIRFIKRHYPPADVNR
jgi:poly(A) polymerase